MTRFIRKTIVVLVLATIVSAAFLLWKYQHLPPQIPLWYSQSEGNQIAPIAAFFLLPFLMYSMIGVNVVVQTMFKEYALISSIFRIVNFFIIISLSYIMITILIIVT